MFNFSSKKMKEDEPKGQESSKNSESGDEVLKPVPETPEPPKQVIDLENLENQPKMQDFGSSEPLPERPKTPENNNDKNSFSEEDDVSFEVPDFTEEDINMNIDLNGISESKKDSDVPPKESFDLSSKEIEAPPPDESVREESEVDDFAEDESKKEESEVDDFAEEEPKKEESEVDDFAEEEPEKEESELSEELSEETSEELPSFDSESQEDLDEDTDGSLPAFEVKDVFSPKFLSKNKYKELISSFMGFEKIIDDAGDFSDEFFKAEMSLKKHSKDLEKNISLIKEKIIEVDKKIFI